MSARRRRVGAAAGAAWGSSRPKVGTLERRHWQSDLTRSRAMVVPCWATAAAGLRAVASPLRFDGHVPQYGLPPLLDEHHAEVRRRGAQLR
jgi:CoA:oxalate CoA-transferase